MQELAVLVNATLVRQIPHVHAVPLTHELNIPCCEDRA